MTYQRLPYEDAATPTQMVQDCTAVGRELHAQRTPGRLTDDATTPASGALVVPDELAAMAAGLELHFD